MLNIKSTKSKNWKQNYLHKLLDNINFLAARRGNQSLTIISDLYTSSGFSTSVVEQASFLDVPIIKM